MYDGYAKVKILKIKFIVKRENENHLIIKNKKYSNYDIVAVNRGFTVENRSKSYHNILGTVSIVFQIPSI
jgi:hypothetical protein